MPSPIVTISRDEFLSRRWVYRAGQHVTILGRTGSGKTYLAYQLLKATARVRLPAISMVMKPRDDTIHEQSVGLDLRTVRSWPPPAPMWRRRPVGYTVWPKHTFDPEEDDRRAWEVFQAAILDSYKRGNRILFADEVAGLTHELRHPAEKRTLAREMEAVWRMGRSMGTGVWAASQRPAWISPLAYSSADHLFLAYEPDARSRQRFDEIGGLDDPKLVKDVTARLPRHHFLYIRREDQRRCIVGP